MPIEVNAAKANFTLRGVDFEPPGPSWAAAPPAERKAYWNRLGRFAYEAKHSELYRGVDVHGKKLIPVKMKYRKDRADGPPLTPHYADSRFRTLLTFKATADHAVLYWQGGWAKIVGYHAFKRGPRSLPVRDVVGLSPTSVVKIKKQALDWWTRRHPGGVYREQGALEHMTLMPGDRELIAKADFFSGFSATIPKGPTPPTPPAKPTPPTPPKPPTLAAMVPKPELKPGPKPKPKLVIPPPARPKPAPAFTITTPDATREEAIQAARDVFRRADLAMEDLALLAGSPSGATVQVKVGDGRSIRVFTDAEHYSSVRSFERLGDALVVENFASEVAREFQGQGRGREVFARQIDAARRLGVDRFEAYAARDDDADPPMNGYKVWPRFGFDADLPWKILDILKDPGQPVPDSLRNARRLSELLSTPEGVSWWETHGVSLNLRFELHSGSRDLAQWTAYLARKAAEKSS